MRGFSQNTDTKEVSTKINMSSQKAVFLDETFFYRSDIGKHEVIIIVRPKYLVKGKVDGGSRSDFNSDCVVSNELLETIVNCLRKAEGVKKILFKRMENVLRIWTVLSGYEEESKRAGIYKQESLLMQELISRKYRFDFFIIEPDEAEEIFSSGATLIFNKGF